MGQWSEISVIFFVVEVMLLLMFWVNAAAVLSKSASRDCCQVVGDPGMLGR